MNTDELAFVNRQLAGMLKAGVPMEVGLKKITESMTGSKLKAQLEELGSRLERGQLVDKAVVGLDLPETYKRLLALGQASQSMPKVLICVADYYERIGTLATRLKGLAIYPMLILVCGLIVSGLMAYLSTVLKDDLVSITQTDGGNYNGQHPIFEVYGSVWFSVFPMCSQLIVFNDFIVFWSGSRPEVWKQSPRQLTPHTSSPLLSVTQCAPHGFRRGDS